jgi:hypothetical protein
MDPNEPRAPMTIGEPTTVCLIVADGVDWGRGITYMRLSFQPTVDQISRFQVPNCMCFTVPILFAKRRDK